MPRGWACERVFYNRNCNQLYDFLTYNRKFLSKIDGRNELWLWPTSRGKIHFVRYEFVDIFKSPARKTFLITLKLRTALSDAHLKCILTVFFVIFLHIFTDSSCLCLDACVWMARTHWFCIVNSTVSCLFGKIYLVHMYFNIMERLQYYVMYFQG